MTRHWLPVIACTAVMAVTVSCTYVGGQFERAPSAAEPMKAEGLAAALMLTEPAWVPIPLAEYSGSRIRQIDVTGDTLYAVDGKATAHAIDLASGEHRWVLDMKEQPTRPIAVGATHIAYLAGRYATVATRDSGIPVAERALEFSPSSNAALTSSTLYAGSWGDGYRLRSVSLYDGWTGWSHVATEPITSAPLVLGSGAGQMLYYASQDRSVVALEPRPAAAKGGSPTFWRVDTLGPNSADLAHDGDRLFVASEDRALYAIQRQAGSILWKWLGSPAPLTTAPQVGPDAVYQPFGTSVAAIDRETGVERYRVAEAERFLTRVGDRDYFKMVGDAIAAVNSTTGEKLAEVRSPLFDFIPSTPAAGVLVFSDSNTIYAFK